MFILKTNKFGIVLQFRACEKCQANLILTNRKFKLGFCSLNEGGTKIKIAKVLKDLAFCGICRRQCHYEFSTVF